MNVWQAYSWNLMLNPDGTVFAVCNEAPIVCQLEQQQPTEKDQEHMDRLCEMYLEQRKKK